MKSYTAEDGARQAGGLLAVAQRIDCHTAVLTIAVGVEPRLVLFFQIPLHSKAFFWVFFRRLHAAARVNKIRSKSTSNGYADPYIRAIKYEGMHRAGRGGDDTVDHGLPRRRLRINILQAWNGVKKKGPSHQTARPGEGKTLHDGELESKFFSVCDEEKKKKKLSLPPQYSNK